MAHIVDAYLKLLVTIYAYFSIATNKSLEILSFEEGAKQTILVFETGNLGAFSYC